MHHRSSLQEIKLHLLELTERDKQWKGPEIKISALNLENQFWVYLHKTLFVCSLNNADATLNYVKSVDLKSYVLDYKVKKCGCKISKLIFWEDSIKIEATTLTEI